MARRRRRCPRFRSQLFKIYVCCIQRRVPYIRKIYALHTYGQWDLHWAESQQRNLIFFSYMNLLRVGRF